MGVWAWLAIGGVMTFGQFVAGFIGWILVYSIYVLLTTGRKK